MPGPQDRWDRHEEPPDSTMDLPRITDPYPASGPDGNHPPHGQVQRSQVPAERPGKDRDALMSPRRGPRPSAGNPLDHAQLGLTERNEAPRGAPQLDEAPLYRAALEKARLERTRPERTRPESSPLGRPPPDRAPHGDVHRDPAPHDRPPHDGPPFGDAPLNGRPHGNIPVNGRPRDNTPLDDGPRYPVPAPSSPAEFSPAAAEVPPAAGRPAEVQAPAARPAELPAAAAPPAEFPHAGATLPEARPGGAQPERITPDSVQHDEPPVHAAFGDGGQARDELPEDRRQTEDRPAPRDRLTRAWDGERPARGSVDELRLRLERLPTGHPSSPYNDDGTRKPPVAQLRQLELPLLGEERPADASGNRSHPAPRTVLLPAAGHSSADDSGRGTDHTGNDSLGGAADHREPAHHREPEGNGRAAGDIGPDHAGVSDPYQRTWPAGQDLHEPRARTEVSRNVTGRRLTPEQRKIADQALTRCRVAEGRNVFGSYGESGLTPALRRTEAELEHGRLAPETELYTLKSADRFKEKLARLIARFPDSDPESLTSDVHDGIRYTFLFDEPHYVDGVAQASDSLEHAGYELVELRPSWASGEYKGINSRWRDSAGLSFEVQWHTPESWDAKQKTQAACERIADPSTPIEEVEQLRAYQRAQSADVPIPPGAMLMRRYKKES